MKNRADHAEVFALSGEKVHVVHDCKKMDLSKLRNDIYIVKYHDKSGNCLGKEKIILQDQLA